MPPDYLRAYGRFVEAIKVAVNEYNLSSREAPLKFVGPILTPDNKIGEVRIVRDTEQEEDEDSGIGMESESLSQDRLAAIMKSGPPSLSPMREFPRLTRTRFISSADENESEPMVIDTSPEGMSMTLARSQGEILDSSPQRNRNRQLHGVDNFDCEPSPTIAGYSFTASNPEIRGEAAFNRFIRDRPQAPTPNAFVQAQHATTVEAEVIKEDSFIETEDEVRQDAMTLDVGEPRQEDDENGGSATLDAFSDDDVDKFLSDHCQEDEENGGSATLDVLSDGDADNVLSDPDVDNPQSTTENVGKTVVMVIDSDTSSDDSDEDSEHSIYKPSIHNSPSEKGSLLRFRRSTPLSPSFPEDGDATEQRHKMPRPPRACSIDKRPVTSPFRNLTRPGPIRRSRVWRPTLWTPIERFTPSQRMEFDGALRHSLATATRGTTVWNGLFNGSREWDD
ncbi:hypothetical protein GCG54_00011556 [Colletotrichum gloeosporioides]|uniref:Uncharacterized protein n=1 Tax=Colletotrichum gloeosporioides TaxID=474922 RepID=A0A8H4FP66_COLGL|nr:uncharacterized protein GCG54_00011556 [Colletotrichum gloeosporioides]KAF3809357.1 hypothetical protein GCG54_00011556 [Colletotrichum gloeosporioides]